MLVATAGANVFSCWWYARRVPLQEVQVSWGESWRIAARLFVLGFAVMWSGLAGAAVALAVRSLIMRNLGVEANGVYQAAWAISGMFGMFIINAMGTDFYPRLTAVADNAPEASRLVNEQTEIGMLLALPGLLGTLTFAPWLMDVFYTQKFREGAALLPFFVISVFCRTITYPLGWILFAKRASGRFALITSMFHLCDVSSLRAADSPVRPSGSGDHQPHLMRDLSCWHAGRCGAPCFLLLGPRDQEIDHCFCRLGFCGAGPESLPAPGLGRNPGGADHRGRCRLLPSRNPSPGRPLQPAVAADGEAAGQPPLHGWSTQFGPEFVSDSGVPWP